MSIASRADGQYKSPILKCVTRENSTTNIIQWQDPNETCGAFQNFNLFYSNLKNGPYQLLRTYTDIAKVIDTHSGIDGSQEHFYYMTSMYSCPGTSLNSDTLSDRKMPYPELDAISIENNFPVYHWQPVRNHPKIWAYVIIDFGANFKDTIPDRTSSFYIDSTFDANSGVYTGSLVGSLSECGETGISPPPFRHRPVFLSLVSNPCEDEIEMSWTRYQGWGPNDEVKDYEVYVKKNSEVEVKVATNDSSVRNFRYNDFDYGDTLCIRVKANHPTKSNVFSYSNQLCFRSTKSQEPDLFQTLSINYLDNDVAEVRWYCSPEAIPKSFDMLKLDPTSNTKISLTENIDYKSDGNGYYSFIDSNASTSKQVAYQMVYEDLCNNKSDGIQGNTNFASIRQIGLYKNKIDWSDQFFNDTILYTIEGYELYFSDNNNSFIKVDNISAVGTEYEHNVEHLFQSGGKFCYKLVAKYAFDTAKPISDSSFRAVSQTRCIDMRTVMWMPNAFKVNGLTPMFKPKFYFFTTVVFTMKIFNRWGTEIFQTNDPDSGWTGRMLNGEMAPEGAYIYHINYTGNDGVVVDKTGTFVLLK